jgi:hypothetical protein
MSILVDQAYFLQLMNVMWVDNIAKETFTLLCVRQFISIDNKSSSNYQNHQDNDRSQVYDWTQEVANEQQMVIIADTVVYPWAVVIEPIYASVADRTMPTSVTPYDLTFGTKYTS